MKQYLEYITKMFSVCLDPILQKTPSYQKRVKKIEEEFNQKRNKESKQLTNIIEDLKTKLESAEQKAIINAENALYHQEQARLSNITLVIPRYEELRRRLEGANQPFLILNPEDNTLVYLGNQIAKKNKGKIYELIGINYNHLILDSSYLPGTKRFRNNRIKIGTEVYEPGRMAHSKGFKIINLRHVGKLEEILENVIHSLKSNETLPPQTIKEQASDHP